MKKLLITILVCLAFVGCHNRQSVKIDVTDKVVNGWLMVEFEYQGCQYFCLGQGVTHKGNCNNPIHTTHK